MSLVPSYKLWKKFLIKIISIEKRRKTKLFTLELGRMKKKNLRGLNQNFGIKNKLEIKKIRDCSSRSIRRKKKRRKLIIQADETMRRRRDVKNCGPKREKEREREETARKNFFLTPREQQKKRQHQQ